MEKLNGEGLFYIKNKKKKATRPLRILLYMSIVVKRHPLRQLICNPNIFN